MESSHRLLTRHKVSLVFFLPAFYREKIRALPGVKHVVNETWFGGQYKDDRPENFFAQFGTDPQELMDVNSEFQIPADQLEAWQHDRAGCIVDANWPSAHGWKIGDRVYVKGEFFPLNLDLTIRGIFTAPSPTQSFISTTLILRKVIRRPKAWWDSWRAGRFGQGCAEGGRRN